MGTHTHEVFFRDTAHGFVTWALATVVGAAVLTSAAERFRKRESKPRPMLRPGRHPVLPRR
jgi:hypothetical protein